MKFEQDGEQILAIEEVTTETQKATIKYHYCWAKKLTITTNKKEVAMNEPLPLRVSYCDWQGGLLPNENRPVHVSVIGSGLAQELVLTPTNSQAEFDFVSEVPGTFVVRATAEFPCESAEIEVVVSHE